MAYLDRIPAQEEMIQAQEFDHALWYYIAITNFLLSLALVLIWFTCYASAKTDWTEYACAAAGE